VQAESARRAHAVAALLRAVADEIEAAIPAPSATAPGARAALRLVLDAEDEVAGARERPRRRAPYP
jgi:hypothetical protein